MLLGLGILLVLGTWQFLRFQEKSEFESLRDSRLEQPPVDLPVADAFLEDNDYRIVRVSGEFLPEYTFLFRHRVRDGKPGYWLGQLLRGESGTVLVNRGWVPYENIDATARAVRTAGPVRLEGLAFTPDQIIPDEETRSSLGDGPPAELTFWDSYDIEGIYAAAGIDAPRPTILIAAPAHSGSPLPVASYDYVTAPYLTAEKHLGYCVTWYTLAGALILMWIAYGFGYLGSYASRASGASTTNASSTVD